MSVSNLEGLTTVEMVCAFFLNFAKISLLVVTISSYFVIILGFRDLAGSGKTSRLGEHILPFPRRTLWICNNVLIWAKGDTI